MKQPKYQPFANTPMWDAYVAYWEKRREGRTDPEILDGFMAVCKADDLKSYLRQTPSMWPDTYTMDIWNYCYGISRRNIQKAVNEFNQIVQEYYEKLSDTEEAIENVRKTLFDLDS